MNSVLNFHPMIIRGSDKQVMNILIVFVPQICKEFWIFMTYSTVLYWGFKKFDFLYFHNKFAKLFIRFRYFFGISQKVHETVIDNLSNSFIHFAKHGLTSLYMVNNH